MVVMCSVWNGMHIVGGVTWKAVSQTAAVNSVHDSITRNVLL